MIGCGAAEVIARVRPTRPSGRFLGDPVLHHRMRANWTGVALGATVRTNSLGLRDRDYGAKPAGGFRVLMLGDSFTEGLGLHEEDTIPRQVERRLRERACRPIEVINAGVTSYSPILEYVLLREVGLALAPDLVVLNFDMTDVHDDVVRTAIARLDRDGLPEAVPAARDEAALLMPPLAWPRGLRVLSSLEPLLNRLYVYRDFRKSSLGKRMLGPLKLTPERLAELGLVGDVRYDVVAIARDGDFPGVREAWHTTERYLRAIHRLVRGAGSAFVVTVYPHPYQVSPDESPVGRRVVGVGPGLQTSEQPFRILEDLGRRDGYRVINLLQSFRAAARSDGPLFRHDDIHHTPSGARVFADAVARALREAPDLGPRLLGCA